MAGKQYRFNPETLSYDVVRDPLRLRVYRFLRHFILLFILVSVVNMVYSSFFYTPKLRQIERHNAELVDSYAALENRIRIDSMKLVELRQRDNSVYRPLLGVDTVHISGVFSPFPEYRYASLQNDPYSDLMIDTWESLDAVTRLLYLQSRSIDELQALSQDKERMTNSIPAIWPIDKRNMRKGIDPYGRRFHPKYKVYRMHQGIDLSAHVGDAVYATADGVVEKTSIGQRTVGYGKQVLINHGYGYKTRYAHLSSIDVVAGQQVKRGEFIGKVGSTGGSTGPHLHYEVIYRGNTVNPVNYFRRDMTEEEFENIINNAKEATFETDYHYGEE